MHAEEKLVKEFHVVCESVPGHAFKVQADSPERVIRKLISDLRAAIAELQKHKGQAQKNQATA
jgi:hypothetical protein